jgi:NAD(P)-dependent dehydrogenase (short-subunit alcohol dehydrogenase family)
VQPPPFWTKSLGAADQISVGLRSAYVATHLAAPLLLRGGRALVVNISYYGAVSYHLDPAYGATKAGLDKMTWDMAQDFREYRVAVVSVPKSLVGKALLTTTRWVDRRDHIVTATPRLGPLGGLVQQPIVQFGR